MKIQVEHIAHLARLDISEQEKEQFSRQLHDILGYMEKLRKLDTDGIEPTSHILQTTNIMRKDELRPSLLKDDALANAPDRAGGFYRVPKIIE